MPPLIITDSNADEQVKIRLARLNGKHLYGTDGCTLRKTPYGHISNCTPASFFFQMIPREKWKGIIENDGGPWLHDLTKDVLPPHDQGATNYCWAHGSVRAAEILRVYQGQSPRILSAESVAVPLTGGRNRGGSADEALGQLMDFGACQQKFWPVNELDIRKAKQGWKEDALDHMLLNWLDVNTWEMQITLALHRIPIAIGLRWWGHLVCQLDPVILPNGEVGIGIDNSWGADWGENGYGVLDEKHGFADFGAFAPISETFADSR